MITHLWISTKTIERWRFTQQQINMRDACKHGAVVNNNYDSDQEDEWEILVRVVVLKCLTLFFVITVIPLQEET